MVRKRPFVSGSEVLLELCVFIRALLGERYAARKGCA